MCLAMPNHLVQLQLQGYRGVRCNCALRWALDLLSDMIILLTHLLAAGCHGGGGPGAQLLLLILA
jgi:hypothetical protein